MKGIDLTSAEGRRAAQWAVEKLKCERDALYLCEHYLHIKSKSRIGFPKLRLNRVQRMIHEAVEQQVKEEGWIRFVCGKARQLGSSTYWRARSFHRTAFKSHINAFLCTHDEPTSYELFDVDKTFWDALPKELQPVKQYDSKTRMAFKGRNSKVTISHALNMNVGASQMQHFVHLTEVARYRNPETIQASLFPSISEAKADGNGEGYSVIVLESTAVFGGVWFKDFCEAAMRGENGYRFLFIPWFAHEDYTVPVTRPLTLTPDERELRKEFGLTDGQLAWRRLKASEYHSRPALVEQEYPRDFKTAWILPAGTLRVFTDEVIEDIAHDLKPGRRADVNAEGMNFHLGGPVEVWQPPVPDVFYDMGVDPAGSEKPDADMTTIEVFRRDTLEQVAEVSLRVNPAAERFHDLVYWLGMAYNVAQVNPDITGGWGNALLMGLQQRGYPNLWHWRRRDDAKERVSNRVGFLFTHRDKGILVANAVTLAIARQVAIHSEKLASELRNFLQVGLEQWGAAPGWTDDHVCAAMLAWLAARDERSGMPMIALPEAPRLLKEPWAHHDVVADLLEDDQAPILMRPWTVR